jgi:prephenate dehydratase
VVRPRGEDAWITYRFGGTTARVVTSHYVFAASDQPTRDPRDWVLEASNDGSTWTTMDVISNASFASRGSGLGRLLSSTTAYRQYRLRVTANMGGADFQLGELQLIGYSGPCSPGPAGESCRTVSTTKLQVAFQGERGAFSEEAGRRLLGEVDMVPSRSFDDMFDAVVSGRCDGAIAPIENTLAGSVLRNYDLLLEFDLTIIGEVVLKVVHNLIAPRGVAIGDIKRVYSHPVALAQCERFFTAHPQFEVVPAYDTAGSVKMILENGRRDEAAIAGRNAAVAYDAEILSAGIESNTQNFTRFFLLVRPDRAASLAPRVAPGERKTSIVFRIGNRPGALYQSLAAFATEGVDLTKIESRPIEGRPWEYSFYLDFAGDRSDASIQKALAHLAAQAENLRILGSYPRAPL